MIKVKTDNGAMHTLTGGEAALHHQTRLADALRSAPRRGNVQPAEPTGSQRDPKLTPRSALPLSARNGDSLPLESRTKTDDSQDKPS